MEKRDEIAMNVELRCLNPTRIISIVGARPQFVKAATISRIIKETRGIREIMIHTGQHYDENMSRIFFEELGIPEPEFHLGIGSMSHGTQTGRMIEAVEQVLLNIHPDWVLVYGDTNSTLAGALAAAKIHIPLAHIEAGLRSFNRRMPEEINRVLTDHLADLLFAPTETAMRNLISEGISKDRIRLVGDVMYDAVLFNLANAEQNSDILRRLDLNEKGYILATIHRAENTDDSRRLFNIIRSLDAVAKEMPVIMPLHPRTRVALEHQGFLDDLDGHFRFINPIGYMDMLVVERSAGLIVTDSGGVQKEAFFFAVPCVTLRDETEWVELIELGWNCLVSPSATPAEICRVIQNAFGATGAPGHPFGDGQAANKIVATLVGQDL